jgi:hypothetical protein
MFCCGFLKLTLKFIEMILRLICTNVNANANYNNTLQLETHKQEQCEWVSGRKKTAIKKVQSQIRFSMINCVFLCSVCKKLWRLKEPDCGYKCSGVKITHML